MSNYIKKKKMGGAVGQLQELQVLKVDPNEGTFKPVAEAPIKTPIKTPIEVNEEEQKALIATEPPIEVDKEINEDEKNALIAAEELKQKLEALQTKVKNLEETLSKLQPSVDVIYTKYENKDADTTLQGLEEIDINELTNYINIYKEYIKTLDEIAVAESEKENMNGFFDSYVVQPISNAIGKMFDKAKNGIAKIATSSGKFWTDTFAKSMEEMEPSLKRIQEAKARIYGNVTDATKTAQNATQGIESATTDVTQVLPTSVINSAQDLKTGATQRIVLKDNYHQNTAALAAPTAGGGKSGRHPNIKEVQKGGAAAAKRAQDSIKQFLTSSVTSSQILSMVKRKTKAKRKRDVKRSRYSRKRAKR